MALRLLLIESDDSLREILTELLHDEGMRVIAVRNATEARGALARERPDVLLADPVFDSDHGARELASELHADPRARGVPVVLLSGMAPHDGWRADAVIGKPFELDDLLESIDQVAPCTRVSASAL